jgi:hypothetical protein
LTFSQTLSTWHNPEKPEMYGVFINDKQLLTDESKREWEEMGVSFIATSSSATLRFEISTFNGDKLKRAVGITNVQLAKIDGKKALRDLELKIQGTHLDNVNTRKFIANLKLEIEGTVPPEAKSGLVLAGETWENEDSKMADKKDAKMESRTANVEAAIEAAQVMIRKTKPEGFSISWQLFYH